MHASSLIAILAAAASIAPAFGHIVPRQSKGSLQPVTVKGNAFFRGNERFYVRGVAYQPGK